MKRIISSAIVLLAVALGSIARAQTFTSGNLVIYRLGGDASGNTSASPGGVLTNAGTTIWLDEYTTAGSFVRSHMMPTNYFGASSPMIGAGTTFGSGLITRSVDGRYIVACGYGATIGQLTNFTLESEFGTEVPRVIGLVNGNGHIDTTTAMTNSFVSGEEERSATSPDGTNIWFGGDFFGAHYTTLGSSDCIQLSTFDTNIREVSIVNNTLYFASGSGTIRIGTIGTQPPPTTNNSFEATLPNVATNVSPFCFALFNLTGGSGPDTLYFADSTSSSIIKYSVVAPSTNWINNGSISIGGAVGLTAQLRVVGTTTNVDLFTTGGGGTISGSDSLWATTDSGGFNAAPVQTGNNPFIPIANSASGVSFRGVAFAPVGGDAFPSGPGTLSVGPVLGFFSTGLTGCSDPSTMTYSLANVGTGGISWSATADQPWVTITPSSGSLGAGLSVTVVASFNGNLLSLPVGTNTANITFSNVSNGNGTTTRPVNETLNSVNILPATDFTSSGAPGGPFSPTTKIYTLTNGSTAFNWSASKTVNWITITPVSGVLNSCGGATITVSLNANANTLGAGNFTDVISFSNTTANTLIDTRNVTLLSGFTYFFDDFSTFTQNTDVNGQKGWQQLGSSAVNPLQVINNTLVYPGNQMAAAQTVYKNFPLLTNPVTFIGMRMAITAAPTNGVNLGNTGPNYIGTVYTGNNGTTTSGTFPNYRFTARALDSGSTNVNGFGATYVLGTRNNGQAGAPWDYGSQAVLSTGQVINLILMTDANGSNSTLYVNPSSAVLGAQTPYVVAKGGTNGSAFAADFGVGSFGLSQFGSPSTPGDGAVFYKIAASTNYADVYNFLAMPPSAPFQITSIVRSGNNIVLTWNSIAGTNFVQVSASSGNYTNNFVNLATLPNLSFGVTNYIDVGGATNKPTHFYRIKGSQ